MTGDLEIRNLRAGMLEVDVLDAPRGACTVVTGEGDSGKTLLAAALSGALDGARGEVRIGARIVSGAPSSRIRRGLCAVPNLPLRIRGVSVDEALQLARTRRSHGRRVSDSYDRFPLLGARRTLRAERLSGGEHQALRLACAWVATPDALVLDSPTTGLAATVVEAVIALALDEARRGAAVLWLDQPDAPLPAAARHRLVAGRLSAPVG